MEEEIKELEVENQKLRDVLKEITDELKSLKRSFDYLEGDINY